MTTRESSNILQIDTPHAERLPLLVASPRCKAVMFPAILFVRCSVSASRQGV